MGVSLYKEIIMLSVGDLLHAFSLQGINENNEFVRVNVEENYQPLKHDWSVVYFLSKRLCFIAATEIAGFDELVDMQT